MKICCHFKAQKCLTVSRNNKIIVKFVTNYHPSTIRLSTSASGQRQGRPVSIETDCAITDHKLFLSRIELISFLSSFYNYLAGD